MRRLLPLAFLAFLLLINLKTSFALSLNGQIQVPFSPNVPVIDGTWTTTSEWADASETKLQDFSNRTAYLRIKHNTTYVFVLVDFASDHKSSTYDMSAICFDTLDNGGALPQKDDYLLGIAAGQAPHWVDQFKGTGAGESPKDAWSRIFLPDVEGAASFSSINDPYEGSLNHRIYEFQVPCKHLGEASNYGFYAFVSDWHNSTMVEWPKNAGGIWNQSIHDAYRVAPSPQNWGDLSGNFIPELPTMTLLLFLTTTWLAAAAFKTRSRRLRATCFNP